MVLAREARIAESTYLGGELTAALQIYCVSDSLFYDIPGRDHRSREYEDRFPTPDEWSAGSFGIWRTLRPPACDMPAQGWKVHLAATPHNATTLIRAAYAYCVRHRLPFKHLVSPHVVQYQCGKGAPRVSSGKAVTIYPRDDEELATLVRELGRAVEGERGPYLLSDIRIAEGPLHVRYGAFTSQWMIHGDDWAPTLRTPDGDSVPDVRAVNSTTPDWVEIPTCLQPHFAARTAARAPFPYRVTGALHHSNGGGVYLAEPFGPGPDQVVIKEARPESAFDGHGDDAVTRLYNEAAALDALADISGIPRVIDRFVSWEHHYLVLDHFRGQPLMKWISRNNPLAQPFPTADAVAEYTHRVVEITAQLTAIVDGVRGKGYAHGDIHPNNVLVGGGDEVRLIDFESACPLVAGRPRGLGARGFQGQFQGDGDAAALAAVKLEMLLPLSALRELEPAKVKQHVDFVAGRYPLPRGYLSGCESVEFDAAAGDIGVVTQEDLVTAISACATPGRKDRLFPGDVRQFAPHIGGLGFSHGAAGVLYALAVSATFRNTVWENWLIDAVRRTPPLNVGFSHGAHGIAYVLSMLGYNEVATALLSDYRADRARLNTLGLEDGLSGIALTSLELSDGGDHWLDTAIAQANRLVQWLDVPAHYPSAASVKPGLLRGWSGPALLFARLFRTTGDRIWIDRAEAAISLDLQQCVETASGAALQPVPRGAALPYLGGGSAGILVVLDYLARLTPETEVTKQEQGLLAACYADIVGHPGLMQGRAGLVYALASHRNRSVDPAISTAVERHIDLLRLHAVPFRGGTAFPGDQLARLSMDLATGSAGVVLALAAAEKHAAIPFVSPSKKNDKGETQCPHCMPSWIGKRTCSHFSCSARKRKPMPARSRD